MLQEELIDFLRLTPPFQFLKRPYLRRLAADAKLEYFPAGAAILSGKIQKAPFLYVIQKGAVGLGENSDASFAPATRRGAGELFGMPDETGTAPAAVRAVEDTLCWLIDLETVLDLLEQQPDLTIFLHERLGRAYVERATEAICARCAATVWTGRSLRSMTAGEAAVMDYPAAPMRTPLSEAARLMTARRQSAIILFDEAGQPVGIITDSDFRAKVVAGGMDLGAPAASVMASPVVEVAAEDLCFDALMTMSRHNIHHVLVRDGERPCGMLSHHDLMVVQGGSPLSFVEKIEAAKTLTVLSEIARQLDPLAARLLREGAGAFALTRIVSELQERLMAKLVAMGVETLGPPPVPFAFLVFGAQARREEPIRSRQHNGLVYAEPAAADAKAADYFRILSVFARDGLTALGFPEDKDGQSAANAAWRMPLSGWKGFYAELLEKGEQASPRADFFDLRCIFGQASLADTLRALIRDRAATARRVPPCLIGASAASLPLRAVNDQLFDAAGGRSAGIDIARHALMPLVAWVRLASLRQGVERVSTLERIRELAAMRFFSRSQQEPLSLAVEYGLLLAAYHNLEYIRSDLPAAGAPVSRLEHLEKRTLNLIFRLQADLYAELAESAQGK